MVVPNILIRINKNAKGQALIETLIAISVAIIIVSALISLSVFSLRNSKQSSLTAQATNIALTQIEYARAYRDNPATTWQTFQQLKVTCDFNKQHIVANQCYFTGPTNITFGHNVGNPFTYFIGFSCAPGSTCDQFGGIIRAGVVVNWTASGRLQSIYNYTDFTNWRGK